jgi:hypothetical protein
MAIKCLGPTRVSTADSVSVKWFSSWEPEEPIQKPTMEEL